jgi:hypothetical protein
MKKLQRINQVIMFITAPISLPISFILACLWVGIKWLWNFCGDVAEEKNKV